MQLGPKTFGHTLTGDVFDQTSTMARILLVHIGGQKRVLSLMANDTENFEDLSRLRNRLLLGNDGDHIRGSCVVEIAAKR